MIPIKKEPPEYFKEFKCHERCVFCAQTTDTWHDKTNNPVCSACSKEHKVCELKNHIKPLTRKSGKK